MKVVHHECPDRLAYMQNYWNAVKQLSMSTCTNWKRSKMNEFACLTSIAN